MNNNTANLCDQDNLLDSVQKCWQVAAWCSGKGRGWSPKDLSSLSLSVYQGKHKARWKRAPSTSLINAWDCSQTRPFILFYPRTHGLHLRNTISLNVYGVQSSRCGACVNPLNTPFSSSTRFFYINIFLMNPPPVKPFLMDCAPDLITSVPDGLERFQKCLLGKTI